MLEALGKVIAEAVEKSIAENAADQTGNVAGEGVSDMKDIGENTEATNDISRADGFGADEVSTGNIAELLNPLDMEGMAPNDTEQARMYAEILGNTPELNPENWNKLTLNEKVEVLNTIDEKLAGVSKRNPYTVVSDDYGNSLNGYCSPSGEIGINSRLLNDTSPEGISRVLNTYIHEARHAYQNYNMDVKVVESNQELVDSWKLNREMGYENGNSHPFDFRNMGFKRYLAQPLEVDARVFAERVQDELNI